MTTLSTGDLDGPAALLESHSAFRRSGGLARLIDATLNDENLVESMASRSYEHANGFDKVVLEVGPTWKLRFHYWPTASASLDGINIHNHRWDFASEILAGQLRAEYYLVKASASGEYESYRYESPDGEGSYSFIRDGGAAVVIDAIQTLPRGVSYALAHDRSHKVSVITEPAASLVLQGPVRKNHTQVLRRAGAAEVDVTVRPMSPQRLAELLNVLSALIA